MLSVGDIVCVTAENPGGVANEKTKGDIGIIKTIDVDIYEVVTRKDGRGGGYWYTEDQLRLATFDEIKQELRRVLS